jgi:predicted ribosome quality control (RQC) complex YloA/Tae2 family protein
MSTKYRTLQTSSGTTLFLGRDENSNDILMKEFEGKSNTILHTVASGSPFCIIESLNFSKKDLKEAAIICASKSQDWRDNHKAVVLHIFTGQQVAKPKGAKSGLWQVKSKCKEIKATKKDIEEYIKDKQ